MGFCPQCGRPLAADLKFCPGCGATRTATATMADPPLRPAEHGTGAGTSTTPGAGPVGQRQDPGLVLLLLLVTLGFYMFFYWWRVSREIDAFTQRPGHAHRVTKIGVMLSLGSLIPLLAGFVAFLGAMGDSFDEQGEPVFTPEQEQAGGIGFLLLIVGLAVLIAGAIALYVGAWRVWKTIEADERRRGEPKPLSPGLMLFFIIVPYLAFLTMWFTYYRTQKGLNGMWDAAGGGATFT